MLLTRMLDLIKNLGDPESTLYELFLEDQYVEFGLHSSFEV